MDESIKDFWELSHNKNDVLWLTGSNLNFVWEPMNLLNKLKPGIKILNIGVGLGNETIELSKKNVIIDVLDISEAALNRVKSITRNQYLSSNITELPINEYDIAVSHLVTQHIDDDELNRQVNYVLRSLKLDGIFAMQFAFLDSVDASPQSEDDQKRGGVVRKLSEIEKIVNNNGGCISWTSIVKVYKHTKTKWQYVHIKRNKDE